MRITTADYLFDQPSAGLLGLTLPGVFAAAAEVAPDAVAATDGGRAWTWRQWQADSQALAAGLQRKGVRSGDVVAIRLPNDWRFLTAHIAVAAIGAVMLPLSPALETSDLRAVLDRVEPVFAVDTEAWARLLADGTGEQPSAVTVHPEWAVRELMSVPDLVTASC